MYVRRPYGVGFLVGAFDATGAHLYETCPSGNVHEYRAMAIGTRAQSAKTYLEKHYESFPSLELDDLIKHALKALAGCVPSEKELDAACASISIVGEGMPLRILDGAELQVYLDQIEVEGGAATFEAETKGDDSAGADDAAPPAGDPMST